MASTYNLKAIHKDGKAELQIGLKDESFVIKLNNTKDAIEIIGADGTTEISLQQIKDVIDQLDNKVDNTDASITDGLLVSSSNIEKPGIAIGGLALDEWEDDVYYGFSDDGNIHLPGMISMNNSIIFFDDDGGIIFANDSEKWHITGAKIDEWDDKATIEDIGTYITEHADELKGEDGATPERGVDYWTDADIASMKSYIDDQILGGKW